VDVDPGAPLVGCGLRQLHHRAVAAQTAGAGCVPDLSAGASGAAAGARRVGPAGRRAVADPGARAMDRHLAAAHDLARTRCAFRTGRRDLGRARRADRNQLVRLLSLVQPARAAAAVDSVGVVGGKREA